MQKTPQPAHMTTTYTVCSPNNIPPYPISAAAISNSGHSPPPTPGLPSQPSPTTALRAQMQTPNPMQMAPQSQPSYSQALLTSLSVAVSSDNMPPSTSARSLIAPPDMAPPDMVPNFQEAPLIPLGKSGDDIMCFVQDLMEQDCATTSASIGLSVHHKDMAQYMYRNNGYGQQLEGHTSSHYVPVSSPSAASDQPCYSPITPVQSPISTCKPLYDTWPSIMTHSRQ